MKKVLLASLILGASVAQAATITLLETTVVTARSNDTSDARFYMDTTTGEGSVTVTVTQEDYSNPWNYPGPNGGGWGGGWGGGNCTPYGGCMPRPMPPLPTMRTIYSNQVAVEGLALHGDRVVYAGAAGDVQCGTFGYSRVLHVPTIYLSGKCVLRTSIDRYSKLTVTLTTK